MFIITLTGLPELCHHQENPINILSIYNLYTVGKSVHVRPGSQVVYNRQHSCLQVVYKYTSKVVYREKSCSRWETSCSKHSRGSSLPESKPGSISNVFNTPRAGSPSRQVWAASCDFEFRLFGDLSAVTTWIWTASLLVVWPSPDDEWLSSLTIKHIII